MKKTAVLSAALCAAISWSLLAKQQSPANMETPASGTDAEAAATPPPAQARYIKGPGKFDYQLIPSGPKATPVPKAKAVPMTTPAPKAKTAPMATPAPKAKAAPMATPVPNATPMMVKRAIAVTPEPAPTPKPKSGGFWWFGLRTSPSLRPSPTPNATPLPVAKPVSVPAPKPEAKPVASPAPNASPTPAPAPKPKPRGFWWFGHKPSPDLRPSPTPNATPVAVAKPATTPAPKQTPASPVVPKPQPTPAPEALPETMPTPTPIPTPTPTPARVRAKTVKSAPSPTPAEPSGMNDPIPFIPSPGSSSSETKQLQSPNAIIAQEAREKVHYRSVRAKALEDSQIRQLQDKADNAPSDAEQKAASIEYYHALYDKMRELDPSLKDRIDLTEAATMRRLEKSRPAQ